MCCICRSDKGLKDVLAGSGVSSLVFVLGPNPRLFSFLQMESINCICLKVLTFIVQLGSKFAIQKHNYTHVHTRTQAYTSMAGKNFKVEGKVTKYMTEAVNFSLKYMFS